MFEKKYKNRVICEDRNSLFQYVRLNRHKVGCMIAVVALDKETSREFIYIGVSFQPARQFDQKRGTDIANCRLLNSISGARVYKFEIGKDVPYHAAEQLKVFVKRAKRYFKNVALSNDIPEWMRPS